ncbi:MAG TPA: DUF4810 domain-containing protein [Burkholderiaceae bacterium]|jgi:hypothetical protein|nr:DUF4810 domain-containing protein [Burkholderiaceae bacterium]
MRAAHSRPLAAPLLLTVALALGGCAAQPMYKWGNYDSMLYMSYKEPDKVVELQRKLEAHVAQLEQTHATVAPGLYAELGTLDLQRGDTAKATYFYAKERDAWPESRPLMETLIKNAAAPAPQAKGATS